MGFFEVDHACTFIGPRPMNFPYGYDEDHEDCQALQEMLALQIAGLHKRGVTTFYSGMSLGVDKWCTNSVLELRKRCPDVRLIAVLPSETQANKWTPEQREWYFTTIPLCDDVFYISNAHTPDCVFRRNYWMVEHSRCLIAVWDGSMRGSVMRVLDYARQQKCAVIMLNHRGEPIPSCRIG